MNIFRGKAFKNGTNLGSFRMVQSEHVYFEIVPRTKRTPRNWRTPPKKKYIWNLKTTPLKKEMHLPNLHFWIRMLVFEGVHDQGGLDKIKEFSVFVRADDSGFHHRIYRVIFWLSIGSIG